MRWRDRTGEWMTSFAFLPRQIGDQWVWLERYQYRWTPEKMNEERLYPDQDIVTQPHK
jgi:hypothetical protein